MPVTMKLVQVNETHYDFLYELLKERSPATWISTTEIPSYAEHIFFCRTHPYRFWWILTIDGEPVGSAYLGMDNSVGVSISAKHRRQGIARRALAYILRHYKPLQPVKSVHPGSFVANIAEGNEASEALFASLGFEVCQRTWRLK